MRRGGTEAIGDRPPADEVGWRFHGWTWSVALVIAGLLSLAALAMCDYGFGTADQLQYLVQLVAIENPGALGDDPYLLAFATLRSVFWPTIAAMSDEASRPAVCLALAIGVAMLGALLLMRLGTILASGRGRPGLDLMAGTAAVLVLVVPKEQNWFGLVSLSDLELTATSAVIPLVIGSMLAWTAGRPVVSLLFALAAAPLHAQTAAYLLTTWAFVALWSERRSPKRLVLPLVVTGAGLVAAVRERGGNAVGAEQIDGLEQAGRALYAELLDPWSAPFPAWGAVFAILAIGAAAAVAIARVSRAASGGQRAALAWMMASLVFPAAGLALLAVGVREPLLWRLMVGRSFMLPQIASLVFFAAWAVRSMRRGGLGGAWAAIALVLVTSWPFPAWPYWVAGLALAAIITWVSIDAVVPGPGPHRPAPRFAVAGVAVATLILAVLAVGRFVDRPHPWLAEDVDPSWRAPQLWARANTAPGTRFLTPPHRTGWRIGSRRPTYGELVDGGLLFYRGEAAIDWAARMTELGLTPQMLRSPAAGPAFAEALAKRSPDWCTERGISYVVTEAAHDVDLGTVVWSSPEYVIRRVR